jgi:hypothetical protein
MGYTYLPLPFFDAPYLTRVYEFIEEASGTGVLLSTNNAETE